MTSDKKDYSNGDIKISKEKKLNVAAKITKLDHEMSVMGDTIKIPKNFRFIQENDVTITSVKWKIKDLKGKTLYKIKARTYKDKFWFSDVDGKDIFEMNVKKVKGDKYEIVIKSCKTKREVVIPLGKEFSMLTQNYSNSFFNKATNTTENLYSYAYDRKLEIFHGNLKIDGGILILRAGRYDRNNSEYVVEMADGLDKTFMTLLAICLIRITQITKDLPTGI